MSTPSTAPQQPATNAWSAFNGTRRSGRTAHLLSLDDFEAAARRALPRPIFGYVAGAATARRSERSPSSPACSATWPNATRA